MRRHPVEPIDELTLRRAQRGDERAWRDLIARFQTPVHALIGRILGRRSQHRVEDLTQETFVRVLEALPRFDPSGPATLGTWILTIATRLTLKELRHPEPAHLDHEIVAHDHTDQDLDRRRLGLAIAEAITALPDPQRTVLVLREYHDLDYSEIADMLGVDIGTVKSRLFRARAALRDQLTRTLGGRHGR